MNNTTIVIAITALTGLGGCANANLSQRKLAETQATIEAASRSENSTNPEVALHLKYANDQVDRAKELMRRRKDDAAQRMLDRARADADLAVALANSEESRQQAREAWNEVNELQQQRSPATSDSVHDMPTHEQHHEIE
ncbi:DUF4398 domain-containing protein [Paraliomyxa miuraensis]|uniref:DUF4398 domain-containing protein n=1 Tax=Paraliomyxa miuraensis TaxID=376150 RepID=UPI00225A4BF9|nr:DUF4398 domain-containing protein [Paraliomyxa miuraensis]MCX4246635.1 DUF4398 domain-containing protein [Paraliomyxa miuraensis]